MLTLLKNINWNIVKGKWEDAIMTIIISEVITQEFSVKSPVKLWRSADIYHMIIKNGMFKLYSLANKFHFKFFIAYLRSWS